MSREEECTLPSGLAGVIRPWKLGDMSVLTNHRLMRKHGPAIEAELLKRAWVRTTDVGPYAFDGNPPWLGEVLQGDQMDALRRVRMLTWGNQYDVNFQCRQIGCRKTVPETIYLDTIPVRGITEEVEDILANSNVHKWRFPECGREVHFGLATGRSMVRGDKLSDQKGRTIEAMLAGRIKYIEGVESKGKYLSFLSDLDVLDWRAIETEMDRIEIGLDTDINVICESCGVEHKYDIPFGVDFFTPEGKQVQRRNRD